MNIIRSFFCAYFLGTIIWLHGVEFRMVHPLYGAISVTEPVLCDLIETKAVQRLKSINQYGPVSYIKPIFYDRFTHSVGVVWLLQKFNASIPEQIAGLLHDVSHTVFSHVGCHIESQKMKKDTFIETKDAYQDKIHIYHLSQTDIPAVLAKHGYSLEQIDHKNGNFIMFDQELPDLCADRIEYNLYGGYIEHYLTREDVQNILKSLEFNGSKWILTDLQAAQKLAHASLGLTELHFASLWDQVLYHWAAQMLTYAVQKGYLSEDDIHFGVDEYIWYQLMTHNDPLIMQNVQRIYNLENSFTLGTQEKHDLCIICKSRAVDPLIRLNNKDLRLTDLDKNYAQEYNRVKDLVTQKRYVTFVK